VRRVLGAILTTAGAVLLVLAGATQLRAGMARDRARAAWEGEEARLSVVAARGRATWRGAAPTAKGAPIGRLWIGSIDLDEVVVEGVGDGELRAGPGHLPGSVLPGDSGNAIIAGHRDRHFSDLDEVAIGDTIVTQTRHERAVWVVTERRVVAADAPALRSSVEPRLTLVTCWPVRYLGPAPERLLITAVRLDPELSSHR
jgi:sortase A